MQHLRSTPTTSSRALLCAGAALAALLLAGCSATGGPQASQQVVRHAIPNSSFPISAAVEIPAGATTVHLSGTVPPLVDKSRPTNDPAAWGGDTQGQTVGVLQSIEKQLQGLGLGMKDVVKMQVFLVADPNKNNRMDFEGFMKGYTQFFGTSAQPALPTRSAFQIAGLVNPAWLVEIEVTAVRPPK